MGNVSREIEMLGKNKNTRKKLNQTTDPGSSENKIIHRHIIFKLQKVRE